MDGNTLVEDGALRERLLVDSPADAVYVNDSGHYGWAAGVPLWEDAVDLRRAIDEGHDVLTVVGVGAVSLDALGLFMDPLGTGAAALTGWLLEHFKPLRDLLDSLYGYPDIIKDNAKTWSNISKHLGTVRDQYSQSLGPGTSLWKGDAAEAYRASARGITLMLDNGSHAAKALADLTLTLGELIAAIRVTVRDMIAETVGIVVGLVTRNPWGALHRVLKLSQNVVELITKTVMAVQVITNVIMKLRRFVESTWNAFKEDNGL